MWESENRMELGIREKQQVFPLILAEFIQWIYTLPGHEITIGQVWRTPEMQEAYIKIGASKTKNSKHLDRLAVDLNLFINDNYQGDKDFEKETYRPLGEKWESLGAKFGVTTRWGGRFGVEKEFYATKVGWDANHFEIV